jgi:7-cyano-7-deazaguanine synthase
VPAGWRPAAGDTPIAVVLVSGGMDSCVAAAIARQSCEPAFLHVGYGQRTEARERRAFHDIARHYGVERILLARFDHLKEIGGSALTDLARDAVDARRPGSSIPDTYVPFRNTHFLAIAVSWAEVLGARFVYIGAVQEDSSGYPDCREEYYDAFNRLVRVGSRPETRLEVRTPLIHMSKEQIVREGQRLEAPLHLTWSCYTEQEIACGRCESCRLRLKGFRAAGARDPIPYAS